MAQIYFATIKVNTSKGVLEGDRQKYIEEDKPLRCFFDWVNEIREDVENKNNSKDCVITNMKIITLND